MNTLNFKDGGLTNDSPILLAEISDDYGINLSGTSIGHDLTAVIDGKTENTLVLNNFYEPETNNFTKGLVRFPLEGLSPGYHTIEVKAWDIANNSATGSISFNVVDNSVGETKYSSGFRENIEIGTNLAPGIYLFKAILRSLDGNEIRESDFSKFVKI